MDFDLSPDQREIKDVARELLAARSPMARVREAAQDGEYDAALWSELVALGWPGIAVAQEHGGQGLGAVELAVLLEELGYACAATPFLATATAAAVIQAAGSDEQRARWLPGLAAGELRGGIGTRELAADAAGAAVVVVLDGEEAQLIVAPETEDFVSIDPTRRFASVAGEGEPLGPGAAERIRVAVAAEVVGVCQRALDMTLAYVKERKQFGVPVGPSRPSPIAARRCCSEPRARARPPTTRPGPPTPIRSCSPRPPRWRAPPRPKVGSRSPRARSRCTAASASPGRRTCTGCTSVRSSTRRCWVAPSAIAPRLLARPLRRPGS
ncbi:MAG TPA: acyl-CoA dehydrogenase family protein [Solirubrobacteraceae bacterium]